MADNDPQEVADWLDKVDAAIPDVLEVAALAFTAGLPERLVDEELREFRSQIAKFAPEVNPSKDEVKKEIDLRFRQVRKMRGEHPLLAVRDVPVARLASVPIRHLDFAKAGYRSHVITELWQRLDTDFWAGIRWWIHEIADSGQLNLMSSAATGLALLAQRAPDEVIDWYLDPWTAEDASWNEQLMAILVIGQMSAHGDMATLALQIVVHWATQGSRSQRRVATYAFSGGLGARFPVNATRRLTHLADQGEPLAGNGHAVLFMTLARQGADGALVLGELQRRMNGQRDLPAAGRVLDNIVYLLAIRNPRNGQPAIAEFLMANPDRVGAQHRCGPVPSSCVPGASAPAPHCSPSSRRSIGASAARTASAIRSRLSGGSVRRSARRCRPGNAPGSASTWSAPTRRSCAVTAGSGRTAARRARTVRKRRADRALARPATRPAVVRPGPRSRRNCSRSS